jgi:hypothetical protein
VVELVETTTTGAFRSDLKRQQEEPTGRGDLWLPARPPARFSKLPRGTAVSKGSTAGSIHGSTVNIPRLGTD